MTNYCNEIIDISQPSTAPTKDSWRPDQQYEGTYPEGARAKEVYFSPATPATDFIKPDWRYMFKLPRSTEWCPWQFWVEIIAYRLGCLIGVDVPPAHVGFSSSYSPTPDAAGESAYGALIEWFYDEKRDVYISGGRIMSGLIDDYDLDKGKQHNLESLIKWGLLDDERKRLHWAGVLTLDALIANTDRHQDNWGIVLKADGNTVFSPAFDNGTALEHSIQEENFHKYQQPTKLKKYLEKRSLAKHHMKWNLKEAKPLNFYEFMNLFVSKFPDTKPTISKHLCFDRDQAATILDPLCDIVDDGRYRLTQQRLDFMLDMIFRRKRLLMDALEL